MNTVRRRCDPYTITYFLHKVSEQVGKGSKRLVKLPTGEQASKDIKALKDKFTKLLENAGSKQTLNHLPEDQYEPTLASMETALWDCRLQMIRIVKEVRNQLVFATNTAGCTLTWSS